MKGRSAWMAASSATSAWRGERWHTGSVARASPVSAKAWQRQPPKSSKRPGQLAHGSCLQAVPRKAPNACAAAAGDVGAVEDCVDGEGELLAHHLGGERPLARIGSLVTSDGVRRRRRAGLDRDLDVMEAGLGERG